MGFKIQNRGLLAREYLDKYPQSTTNAIARMLFNDLPSEFKSFESARGLVRYHRGELVGGTRKHKTKVKEAISMRTEEEKRMAMGRFNMPESDYQTTNSFVIPRLNDRGVIFNDIHLPYQDNDALETAINFAIDFKPNFIYLNGDTMDMYQASRYVKDIRLRNLAGEIEMTRQFLKDLKDTFNCPVYFKIGNHEDRWEIYLRSNAPELLGIDDFKLENVLRLGELGVQLVKSKQVAKIGKMTLAHGHEFGHSVFSPVNAARGLYMRAKIDCAIGHHHVTSEHAEKDMSGNVVSTFSIGSLCGLSPDYLPYNRWNHGFATITTEPNGDYDFRNYKIIDGKVR